jgi:hemerythrin-like domain-containing protein
MLRDRSLIPLSQQHHNGLALCVLARRALAADSSGESVARQARRIADRFELELSNHFELEEKVLFAGAVAELGPLTLVDELIAEHRRLESLVEEIRQQPSAASIEQFCALLTAHIRREESDLFGELQRRLARETLDRMGARFEAEAVRICL